jgi:hypothetical protein
MRAEIYLPGTPRNASPLKQCNGPCQSPKPPEGGVQMKPQKWICASCWQQRMNARRH